MKKLLYTLAAFSFVFVACNKQEIVPEEGTSQEGELTTVTIKARNGDADTKAAISDGIAFTWTIGDQIAVHTDAGRFYDSDALTTGGATADFTVSLSGNRNGYAVYPASVAKSWDGTNLTLTLPSEYTYAQVSGDNTPLPMIADNTGATLNFYHVGALVRLTVPGIPATADKLVITFDKDVTGDFTLASPQLTIPISAITTSSATDKNFVTITLTPGTDYSGAVISIPVPTVTGENKLSITSVVAQYGTTPTTIETVSADLSNWSASRAHGKKATAAFTPSMYSMVLAPGNMYTNNDGDFLMSPNYYEHTYNFTNNGEYNAELTYSVRNRTHFNWNEMYYLMGGTTPTYALARTAGYYKTGEEGVYEYDIKKTIGAGVNEKTWRTPTLEDWDNIVVNPTTRPGASFKNGDEDATTGWKFLKVFVTGMVIDETTYGTTTSWYGSSEGSSGVPSTEYQSGLLIFPDNVSIIGNFAQLALGQKNSSTAKYNDYVSKITKAKLDELISQGCSFLPSVGRWTGGSNGFGGTGSRGDYWTSVQYNTGDAYNVNFRDEKLNYSENHWSKIGDCRSLRLVRDLN